VSGSLRAGLRTPSTLFSPDYGNLTRVVAHRTYETIQALSQRINVPIETPFPEGKETELIHRILDSSSQVVLICWEHHRIPTLAAAIPTLPRTVIPAAWSKKRFDLIWCFTRSPGTTQLYTFTQIPQQLLNGDTDTIIT
ncbi:MAG: hypothetical protein ACRDSH_03815, partial [Pseudonocardiaceae bacterium]